MDITAFAKVDLTGPGAEALLCRLLANRLPTRAVGIALAYMPSRA